MDRNKEKTRRPAEKALSHNRPNWRLAEVKPFTTAWPPWIPAGRFCAFWAVRAGLWNQQLEFCQGPSSPAQQSFKPVASSRT
jgi:hypothetical protein